MNKLIIVKIEALQHSVNIHYVFDGQSFNRGFGFNDTVNLRLFNNDIIFQKLLKYSVLSDAIYTFGLGYYDEIIVPFSLTQNEIDFFEEVLFHGLAEFRFENSLPIYSLTKIVAKRIEQVMAPKDQKDIGSRLRRAFVLNGGGKDGVVAIEIMKKLPLELAWFVSGDAKARQAVVRHSNVHEVMIVDRITDGYVGANKVLSGHKPMSLYVAMVSCLSAYIDNRYFVVAACEFSASHPNLVVDGLSINHQYTKSFQFEKMLRSLFESESIPVHYFSITRQLYDINVMEIFSKFPVYHRDFISCNESLHEDMWCMNCSKCAFVIGSMYIFALGSATTKWGKIDDFYSKNPSLLDHSIELINPEIKPFECIGTTEENYYLLNHLLKNVKMSSVQQETFDKYVRSNGLDTIDIDFTKLQSENNFPTEYRVQIESIIEGMIV